MNTAVASGTLLEKEAVKNELKTPEIIRVSRKHGVSPFRQLRESVSLRFGAGKLRPADYYGNQLFDPEMSMTEKREFISTHGSKALNKRLAPEGTMQSGSFVANKVLHGALLRQLGVASPQIHAVVARIGEFGSMATLRAAAEVAEFLSDPKRYPLFGKPLGGSLSVGSVLLSGFDTETGMLTLANGDQKPLDDFCEEVITKYSSGYIFQEALQPHPDLVPVTGDKTGSVRIVTVMDTNSPRIAYGLWKIPAPGAMSDNFWQDGSMIAQVEMDTGKVLACRQGTGLNTVEVTHHPVSGAEIVGIKLPGFADACDLARKAHAILPDLGVCGWDIGLTADGPVIIECNNSPHHTLYQLSHRRGALNPELMPLWKATEARQKKRLAIIREEKKGKRNRIDKRGS